MMMDRGIWKPNVETSPTCPRCGSINTKFCYYNNYSLTQPRYFCKSCRRYWTKGGSLRNVPVGGGCRKTTTTTTTTTTRSSSRLPKPIALNNNTIRASSSSSHHHGVNLSKDEYYFSNSSSTITSGTRHCSITGSLPPPVTVSRVHDDGRPDIDLALVYANFLNPTLKPSSQQTDVDDDDDDDDVGSSPSPSPPVPPPPPLPLHFSGAHDRPSSSNEHVTYRNPFYFGGGMNSFEKQQIPLSSTSDHHHQINHSNDYPLLPPYLPREEMIWPSSDDDLLCPADPVIKDDDANYNESTAGINLPQIQDSNQVDDQDGSLFHIPNYGIFSRLDDK